MRMASFNIIGKELKKKHKDEQLSRMISGLIAREFKKYR